MKTTHEMETAIIRKLVEDALRAGYDIVHNDGEGDTIESKFWKDKGESDSHIADRIVREINATDMEYLIFHVGKSRVGSVLLVYGNDGHDIIADHTDTTEMQNLLKGANALAESFYDEWCKEQMK